MRTLGRSLMYSRKIVGPGMERWGTVALTRYYCKEFSPRTTKTSLLLQKDKMMPYTGPGIPYVLNFWRRPACHTITLALDISSVIAQITLIVLSNTTVTRSTVDQEELKPHWKSEQRPNFSRWSTSLLSTSKTLLTT